LQYSITETTTETHGWTLGAGAELAFETEGTSAGVLAWVAKLKAKASVSIEFDCSLSKSEEVEVAVSVSPTIGHCTTLHFQWRRIKRSVNGSYGAGGIRVECLQANTGTIAEFHCDRIEVTGTAAGGLSHQHILDSEPLDPCDCGPTNGQS
jgi:hypothetical protein